METLELHRRSCLLSRDEHCYQWYQYFPRLSIAHFSPYFFPRWGQLLTISSFMFLLVSVTDFLRKRETGINHGFEEIIQFSAWNIPTEKPGALFIYRIVEMSVSFPASGNVTIRKVVFYLSDFPETFCKWWTVKNYKQYKYAFIRTSRMVCRSMGILTILW